MPQPHQPSSDSVPPTLSIEAQVRIRDELHSVQVGLYLLRNEMLSGDYHSADLTFATLQQCLGRLSNDEVLALPSGEDDPKNGRF